MKFKGLSVNMQFLWKLDKSQTWEKINRAKSKTGAGPTKEKTRRAGGFLTMGQAQVGVEGAGWARSGVQQVTHAHGGRKLDAVLLHLAAEERRQGRRRGRRRG